MAMHSELNIFREAIWASIGTQVASTGLAEMWDKIKPMLGMQRTVPSTFLGSAEFTKDCSRPLRVHDTGLDQRQVYGRDSQVYAERYLAVCAPVGNSVKE